MSDTQSRALLRIEGLLDAGSFVEVGGLVTARNTDFKATLEKKPSDGVVTGYGTVDGSLVYVYSQDMTVLGGTVGEMHAKKIANVYRLAAKMGAPIVGFLESGGLRLEESTDALSSLGSIYRMAARLSGSVPQIVGVFGSCGGGLSFIPAIADFVFMEKDAHLFVNSPDAIPGSSRDRKDLSTAASQEELSNIDFTGSEEEILAGMRNLLSVLPANFGEDGYTGVCEDDLSRLTAGIDAYAADTMGILQSISDGGMVIEAGGHGKSMITAFIRLGGTTVGVIANRSAYTDEEGNMHELDGKICPCGVRKAAKMLRFCDAFNIPVLTIASATGYKAKEKAEDMLPKAAARLIYAYANADVPKVTLCIGSLYGSAAVLMGSRSVGADMVYAWPDTKIGTMAGEAAAKILKPGADAATLKETAEAYDTLQQSVASAAARGYVDCVISPAETRKYLIGAFEMLYAKRETLPDKKHGTV